MANLIPLSFMQTRNPFVSLQTELDKAMQDFYQLLNFPHTSSQSMLNQTITPAIDIVEDDKNFKIEAEMPGMGEEDIKVSVNKSILTLKGEKKTSKKDEGKNYMMREIGYGYYERDITLPDNVDIDQAKATFKKGMVWINIPKKPGSEKQSRELKIEKA